MSFLQCHLLRDLEQLMQTLGRSADDAAHTVHLVLCCLLRAQGSGSGEGQGKGGPWDQDPKKLGQQLSSLQGCSEAIVDAMRPSGAAPGGVLVVAAKALGNA